MSCNMYDIIERVGWMLMRHPEGLLQSPTPEEVVSDKLSLLVREVGYRSASRINLWEIASEVLQTRDPVKILETFRHPLQPDVDLLIEDDEEEKLWGFEIKLIRWQEDWWRVIPKGRFYDGIGQALALTTMGVDYACLCHIFIESIDDLIQAEEVGGPDRARRIVKDRIEFLMTYNKSVFNILLSFNVPIGLLSFGVLLSPTRGSVEPAPAGFSKLLVALQSTLARLKEEPFRFTARLQSSNELLQREEIAKIEGRDELEKLHQQLITQGRTYKQQLAVEQDGQAEAILEMVRRFASRVQKGSLDFWDLMEFENYLIYQRTWEAAGGEPSGLEGLCNFFRSVYYRSLPTAKISSQLYADILTEKQRAVKPSDSMDIRLLSVAIPVAHYIFTDKDMENRIKRRKIDQEWGTQVFSVKTVKDLLTQLGKLS